MKVICVCYIFCSSLINIIIFHSILDSVADGPTALVLMEHGDSCGHGILVGDTAVGEGIQKWWRL